jgi:hypothetical protein
MNTKFDNPEAQAPANTFDSPPPTNKPGQMTPVTKSGIEGGVKYVVSSMQGWRDKMEDAHTIELNLGDGNSVFGVFDGHGGPFVSTAAAHCFTSLL